MKSTKNHFFSAIHSTILFSISIFFSAVLIVTGCKDQNELLPAVDESNGFNSASVKYSGFTYSSAPISPLNHSPLPQNNRAQIYWYNIAPSDVRVSDIMGTDTQVKPQYEQVQTLDVTFNPDKNGIYNRGQLSSNPAENWGGFFKNISFDLLNPGGSKNLVMKIWIKIIESSPEALLHIDLGEISEDIIPNLKLDTEDKNMNDLLDEGEDVGLDKLPDAGEEGYIKDINPDPNNDNYGFQLGNNDYSRVNCPEGNGQAADLGRVPETEDLNKNYILDTNNNYGSFQIPLDINKLSGAKIINYGKNGWLQVKIPIDLPDETIGNSDKSPFQTIRLWITNAAKIVHLRIAEINFEEI